MKQKWRQPIVWMLRLAPFVVVVAVWMYATGPGGTSPLLLPDLGEAIGEFIALVTSADIVKHLWITTQEIFAAFGIALVSGFLVGLWGSRSQLRAKVIESPLAWGYMVPNVLFYPLFILWAGIGMGSKVAFAALAGFFPIAMNTLSGFRNVDRKYLSLASAFGATKMQLEWNIKLGAASPMILAGVRIGAALSIINVILAEILAARGGLGYELTRASQTLQIPRVYALIVFLAVFVAVLNYYIEKTIASSVRM